MALLLMIHFKEKKPLHKASNLAKQLFLVSCIPAYSSRVLSNRVQFALVLMPFFDHAVIKIAFLRA
jgi:hypothetical protein